MTTDESEAVARVMHKLHYQEVLASWRTGERFRRTRRGEWDTLATALVEACEDLHQLLKGD